ncbi:MAG TPA: hypothetical protein VHC22_03095 [Pirellulales bacterium]|nr:hypothetical protein [Pirellulales bacterium]
MRKRQNGDVAAVTMSARSAAEQTQSNAVRAILCQFDCHAGSYESETGALYGSSSTSEAPGRVISKSECGRACGNLFADSYPTRLEIPSSALPQALATKRAYHDPLAVQARHKRIDTEQCEEPKNGARAINLPEFWDPGDEWRGHGNEWNQGDC